jgi:hypothetical protein
MEPSWEGDFFGQHSCDKSSDDSFYIPICNKCVRYHRNLSGSVTCDIRSDRIPHGILTGDETYDHGEVKKAELSLFFQQNL